jgi:SulP family sulfate permease
MAGCAMIGQSVINIKSGGRGRLSSLVAGTALLLMVVFFEAQVSLIPMAVLVSVMIMVSIGTFNWGSIRDIKKYPLTSNLVMITTVIVVVWTHNLAYGVLAGVLLAALFFANRVGHFMYVSSDYQEFDDTRNYQIVGQVFFASADKMLTALNFKEAVSKVVINLNRAHFWDITAVSALDKAVIKFRREGALVEVRGLNEASETIIDLFSVYDKPEEIDKVLGGH